MSETGWYDHAAGVESIVTVLAIVVGGGWALFFRREHFPRAKLAHKIYGIPIKEGEMIVRVDLCVENVGAKLLRLTSVTNRLQQILPIPELDGKAFDPTPSKAEPEIAWPGLGDYFHDFKHGEREIEPGESETFQFDYRISAAVKMVQLYSYVTNPAKVRFGQRIRLDEPSEIGWNLTDIHDLEADGQSIRTK